MSAQHIHVVDGKQIPFPIDNCPICGTSKAEPQQTAFVPNVHRKGYTVVVQSSKGVMSTTTWWAEGGIFLHSVQKMVKDKDGRAILGTDQKPLWNDLAIRMNISMVHDYLKELAILLADVQALPQPQRSEAPKRQ